MQYHSRSKILCLSITSCSPEQALLQLSQTGVDTRGPVIQNQTTQAIPRWEVCTQVVKTSSYCLSKRAACTFTGIPLHTKWLKISFPPALAQTVQLCHCFLLPWQCFCIIKLLHSLPPWKPLPRPQHPQKAKLKDSWLQKKTLKTIVKNYNSV